MFRSSYGASSYSQPSSYGSSYGEHPKAINNLPFQEDTEAKALDMEVKVMVSPNFEFFPRFSWD
jgi:hypothetical protein